MSHRVETVALTGPSPGTERKLLVHRFGTPGARPKVYMHAALHADEWPSILVVQKLLPRLIAADAAGEVTGEIVVLPFANPIGLAQRIGGHLVGRYALDGSGNFNRDWPDLAPLAAPHLEGRLTGDAARDVPVVRQALLAAAAQLPQRTEVQQWRAAIMGLSVDADTVLDLHCDGEAFVHTYANARHAEIVRELGAEIASPVNLLETDPGGGAFDEANARPWWRLGEVMESAGHLPPACFAVTVELRGRQDIRHDLAEADAAGLFRFLQRRGALAGDPGPLPALSRSPSPLEAVDTIEAPKGGLVVYRCELGAEVKAGEAIADIYDPAEPDPAKAVTQAVSRTDGLFFARADSRLVEPGARIAKVAGTQPLDHRRPGTLLED